MTKFYDLFKQPFAAIDTAIKTKSSIKTVAVGERFKYANGLPAAVVNVAPSPFDPISKELFNVGINFDVVLLIRETEPDDWFDEVLKVMGDVFDAIMANPTLSGTVKELAPNKFAPGEIKTQNKFYYGGVVGFKAKMRYTPY